MMARSHQRQGRGALAALIVAFGCAAAATVMAQDFPRDAPKAPKANPVPAPQLAPPPPRRPAHPGAVVIAQLNGIRLVSGAAGFSAKGVQGSGVVSDVPFAAGVVPALRTFLGKPLTQRDLARLEGQIVAFYRAGHHPFVAVVTPQQDVTSGVLQIVVAEYKVGKISVRNNRWFSSAEIRAGVRARSGDTIDSARLDDDLAWLNRNPFRTVDLVATPGSAPATTDLDLVVHDHFPGSVYAAYADDGSPATGLDRWKFGALWGDVLGTGAQFGYQFTASSDLFTGRAGRPGGFDGASFLANALDLNVPLPWRHSLEIFGTFEQDRPDIGPDLAGRGDSAQASLRYVIPLPPLPRLTQQLSLGYDFKTTNNNLDFGGTLVSANRTEIDQFPITYQASLRDSTGLTTFTDSLVLSPGGLTPLNTDAAFQPGAGGAQTGVAFAHARYVYDRLDVERDTALPRNLTWVIHFTGQTASGNLLPSEQLNVGGIDTVRGFEEEVVGGSDGVLLSTELRGPVWHPLGGAARAVGGDNLQADAFVDYAHVLDPEAIAGAAASDTLASAGLGLRYAVGRHLSARIEAGVPFEAPSGLRHHTVFANVAITVTP
jgi:hemolysin activation/secretion protein